MDITIPDGDRAYRRAQQAFQSGQTFNTVCEWCGWSGGSDELVMAVWRDGGGADRFCPLCDALSEWKLWEEDQDG